MKLTIMSKQDVVDELRNRYSSFLDDAAKWVQSKNPGVDYETCEMHAIDMIYERCVSGFNSYDYIDTPQKAVEHARTSALGKQITEYGDKLRSEEERKRWHEEYEKKEKLAKENFLSYCYKNGLNVEEEKNKRREKKRKRRRIAAIILLVIALITAGAMTMLEFHMASKQAEKEDPDVSAETEAGVTETTFNNESEITGIAVNDENETTEAVTSEDDAFYDVLGKIIYIIIIIFKNIFSYRILWVIPLILLIISIVKFVKSSKSHLDEFSYLSKKDYIG